MADISRDHFDESRNVVKKVLQQGRHLVDADWNEQVDALKMVDRRMLSAMLQHTDYRFGDGFKVVGTGATLALTIKAGRAAFQIGSEAAIMLNLASNYTLSGFTAFPGGGRTDYIYIDIHEDEFDASDDPDIVSPSLGQETCVDIRLVFDFHISEGGVPSAAPSGHTYISLGTVVSTNNTLSDNKVTNLLTDYYAVTWDDFCGQNFLRNGGFQYYDGNIAKHWLTAGGSYVDMRPRADATAFYVKVGSYCGKGAAGGLSGGGQMYQAINDFKKFRGRTIFAFIYAGEDSGQAGTLNLTIDDGVTTTDSGQVALDIFGAYTKIAVVHTVSPAATKLEFQCVSGLSSVSYYIYFGAAGLFLGPNTAREFEDNPLDLIDEDMSDVEDSIDLTEFVLYHTISESYTSADAVSLDNSSKRHVVDGGAGGDVTKTVIRIPYYHNSIWKKAILRGYESIETGGGAGYVYLKAGASLSANVLIGHTTPTAFSLELDLTTLLNGDYYEIAVDLQAIGMNMDAYLQKVQIVLSRLTV